METAIDFIFNSKNFMPHGSCFLWTPELLWLLVISDVIIAFSYFSIPFALSYLIYRRKDFAHRWIFILFSLFIFACGMSHIMSIITVWTPTYGLMGLIKALTAIISFVTAILLWTVIPKVLSLPNARQLNALSKSLEDEIKAHEKTKRELKQLNEGLDKIVELRVKELQGLNQELKDNKEKYELLLNTVDDGIYGIDLNGNTSFINPAACKMFACKAEDIIGKSADRLLNVCLNANTIIGINNKSDKSQIHFKAFNEEVVKSEHVLCVNQKCLPVNFTRTPLRKNNKHSGYVIIFRDISEHKRAESLLIQAKNTAEIARRTAEEANKAKSQFLSRMSHELRTPMNAILGFAQLLEDEDLTEDQHDDVKEILSAGNHLMELINEVLELAKIESGKLEMNIESINLNEVIYSSFSLVKNIAEKNSIRMIDEITPYSNFYLTADKVRLKQVLVNLLSNAIKYNIEGGSVILSFQQSAKKIKIHITDTGNGMTEEQLSHLFQPFERLGAINSNIEGTGIGLVITKNIIELMGGSIEVASTVNKGSRFSIDLILANNKQQNTSKA